MRTLTLIAFAALLAACGIVDPATELAVENRTGSALDVRVWGIPAPSATAFAVLHEPQYTATIMDGEVRHWTIEPGWYHVRGETDNALLGATTVRVADGTMHRLPFYVPEQNAACPTLSDITWCPSFERDIPDVREP